MDLRWHAALALTSTVLLLILIWSHANSAIVPSQTRDYTYIGDDYPLTWPLPEMDNVIMYPEDTHRYALRTPEGTAEWRALLPFDDTHSGFPNGTIHLGPHDRPFTVAMFHQLQCLDIIRSALAFPTHSKDSCGKNLRDHCLNYLRQAVLCHAHTDLESIRSDQGPKIADLTRSMYICRDWRVLYGGKERGETSR
ncbi:hypothetical protein EW146_g7120 [Bondarzewia mesenterica]|uniref:Oxidase ustYa n=1 Tax=Bondarzewia mesenterica TaxID=1095465 RepID=A0A4S4LLU6_9AGAM|nr:hypothetical protein EW146_g7120 [Bondarzewia mesenterica]